MTNDNAVSAATPAANGFGDTHSTAGFKALTLGSIRVVYGDIGTSPLYALREAVVASGATGSAAGPPLRAFHRSCGILRSGWRSIRSTQPHS
jgi:KUP system potassium uptake protein